MVGVLENNEEEGLIPRLSRDILIQSKLKKNTIDQVSGDLIVDVQLQVSFYEIYNERVFDLLSTNSPPTTASQGGSSLPHESNEPVPCRVRQHPDTGAFIEGLTFRSVDSYEAVLQSLFEGFQRRITGETLMNAKSSRSHAVFTITITQTRETRSQESIDTSTITTLSPPPPPSPSTTTIPITATTTPPTPTISRHISPNSSPNPKKSLLTYIRSSKICLVDLAGSERLDSTKAKGVRMKEGTMINLSLSTLGDVIKALSLRSSTGNSPKHIPYRNSILTWLLKDCIGGNSRTTILATISPVASSYAESLNTIRFITKAKYIVNKVNVNDKLNQNANNQNFKLIEEMKYKLINCEKRIFELQQVIEKNGLLNQVSVVENDFGLRARSDTGININMDENTEIEGEEDITLPNMIEDEDNESGGQDTSHEDDVLINSLDGSEENDEEIVAKFNQIEDIEETVEKSLECNNNEEPLASTSTEILISQNELEDEHLSSEILEFTVEVCNFLCI